MQPAINTTLILEREKLGGRERVGKKEKERKTLGESENKRQDWKEIK